MTSRRKKRSWLALIFLTVPIAGCFEFPGKPKEADRPVRADEVVDFGSLFKENCSGCHGSDGKLGPAPPLNDPIFLGIVPDTELLMVIREGRTDTLMPPWAKENGGPLTAAQVKVLAEGLKKQQDWSPTAAPKDTPPLSPEEGKPSGNAKTGLGVFARACASCHGERGGGEQDGKKLVGGAINQPAFLGLLSERALRRLIITGRPDLGMPSFHENTKRAADFKPLTSQDVADLVALLVSWKNASLTEN